MKEDPLKSVELSEKKEGSVQKRKMKNEEREILVDVKLIQEDAENKTHSLDEYNNISNYLDAVKQRLMKINVRRHPTTTSD